MSRNLTDAMGDVRGRRHNWQRQGFADFAVPAWFVENCEDESWAQDACPSFHYRGRADRYRVWVDCEDPSARDAGYGNLPKRFAVQKYVDAYKDDELVDVFESDDLDALIAYLKAN